VISCSGRCLALPCVILCLGHIGPHIDANLLCQGSALVLPHKTGRFLSGLVVYMMSSQFFLGLPSLRFLLFASQHMACFGNLLSSIRKTCPNHRSLLSLTVRLNVYSVAFSMTFSFRTLSLHEMPSISCWNLWCAASNFFFCVADRGHNNSAL